MKKAHGKNAFLFVIVCVAMDMLAFGIFIPVMPTYLEEITGKQASEVVQVAGILMATFGVLNFLTMPIIGGLSDRFGRRPVLLVSIGGLCIDFLIMGFAHSLFMLFIGRALAGVTSATYSTASSYIADVTEPEERGRAFGMIGAAFGIGFVVGPVIGGFLGEISTRLPFFVSAALAACNFLYGLFVLPESLAPENRRKFDIMRANPLGAFLHFGRLPHMRWFILAAAIFAISHSAFPATWNFYGKIRYDRSEWQIALSLALVGLGSGVVQATLTGRFIKLFGPTRTALIGLTISMTAMFLFASSVYGWMAYMVIVVSALGGVANPAIQQIMTGITPKNAQGELQGTLASVQSICGLIIGPLAMTQALHYFANPNPIWDFKGANFLLAGLLAALAMIPFLAGVRANRAKVHKVEEAAIHPEAAAGAE